MQSDIIIQVSKILNDYFKGKVTAAQAAKLMHVTPRTLYRRARAFEERGFEGLLHGNTDRAPKNKFDDSKNLRIKELIQTKYKDMTIVEMTRHINEEEGIKVSRETVRRLLVSTRNLNSTRKHTRRRV